MEVYENSSDVYFRNVDFPYKISIVKHNYVPYICDYINETTGNIENLSDEISYFCSDGYLNIFSNDGNDYLYTLSDVMGKCIYSTKNKESFCKIDVSNILSGMYVISFKTNSKDCSKRIFINN